MRYIRYTQANLWFYITPVNTLAYTSFSSSLSEMTLYVADTAFFKYPALLFDGCVAVGLPRDRVVHRQTTTHVLFSLYKTEQKDTI